MKKLFIASVFTILSQVTYSQSANVLAVEDTKHINTKNDKTLKINTSGYDKSTIKNLKEELSAWQEKVEKVEIDDSKNLLTIIHNKQMDPKELFEVVNKYIITKNSIISYQ